MQAHASSDEYKSRGVLTLSNGSKQVVFDSEDFAKVDAKVSALADKVDTIGTPKLKITYHEHTDDCYVQPSLTGSLRVWGFLQFINSSGTYVTTVSPTTTYHVFCVRCGVEFGVADNVYGLAHYGDNSATSGKPNPIWIGSAPIPLASGRVCQHVMGGERYFKGYERATVRNLRDPYLICDKDETTIENVEIVLE